MTREETETQGRKNLADMVMAALDPHASPQPKGKNPAGRSPGRKDLRALELAMRRRTEELLAERLHFLRREIFALTPGQVETLRSLSLPEPVAEGLESLSHAALPTGHHRVRRRLEIIGCVPEDRNWRDWWVDQSEWNYHVPEWDRNMETEPGLDELDLAVAAVLRAASEEMPTPAEVANRIRERGRWDRTRRRWEAEPELRLSRVWCALDEMARVAVRLGAPEGPRRPDLTHTPESLLQELRAAGMEVLEDMGTTGTPEEMRELPGMSRPGEIRVSAVTGLWTREGAHTGGIHPACWQAGGTTRLATDGKSEEITPEEICLVSLTAPSHPATWLVSEPEPGTDANQAALAWLNRTDPERVGRILAGKDPGPEPERKLCPAAGTCAGRCGELQRAGEREFPITRDGTHLTCRYWKFLERYGNLAPERRAAAALAELERIRQASQERAKEERRERRREAAEEPAAEETATNAPEPERAQPALFTV